MKEILIDLLDDRNIILYALMLLAIIQPDIRELIAGGLLGYWTKEAKNGVA